MSALTSHGLGGAGNVAAEPVISAQTENTPVPASPTGPVSHGRGGAGNITEDATAEQAQAVADAEAPPVATEADAISHGRGGAGNIQAAEGAAEGIEETTEPAPQNIGIFAKLRLKLRFLKAKLASKKTKTTKPAAVTEEADAGEAPATETTEIAAPALAAASTSA